MNGQNGATLFLNGNHILRCDPWRAASDHNRLRDPYLPDFSSGGKAKLLPYR